MDFYNSNSSVSNVANNTTPNNLDIYKPVETKPLICIAGCVAGTIPGIILWLLLSYLNFNSGMMGFVIVSGSLITYKKLNKKAVNVFSFVSIVFSVFVIFVLTTSIEASNLRSNYNKIVNDTEYITELREELITEIKSNGSTEEENLIRLKAQYNVKSFDDIEGFNRYIKDVLINEYVDTYRFPVAPDSFTHSYKCVFNYLLHDFEYSKEFLTDLIVGIAFAVLAYALITNSTFMSNEED